LALAIALFKEPDTSPLERFGDVGAILLIVLLNAVLGTIQEGRAESALSSLRSLTSATARVRREGLDRRIDARELVCGDVIVLQEGDRVPADIRLVASANLSVDESSLTGESAAVAKSLSRVGEETPLAERSCLAFMGTYVVSGTALGLVTSTGIKTELGRIASLLSDVETPKTPLQVQLDRFGKRVVLGCALLAVGIFLLSALRTEQDLGFSVLVAVSLAVAAIPEGLPAITTIVLALGVRRMAKQRALLRRMAAVETLGSAHIICTDKTGTLTQNHMTVRRLWCPDGASHDPEHLPPDVPQALARLLYAVRYTPAAHLGDDGTIHGDHTDVALRELHERHSAPLPGTVERATLPFDPTRKLASVLVHQSGVTELFVHGAPEAVVARCAQTEPLLKAAALTQTERWAAEGLRVMAVASRRLEAEHSTVDAEDESPLCLIGLCGLSDPPRTEVIDAIRSASAAGIRTLMITGDHPLTARAIASELGILEGATRVTTGAELERLDDAELDRQVLSFGAIARATATDKLRIVKSLRRHGLVVAMTGDGVNDAPAIRAADIGVAMGKSGTDVTREAADLVLADDNYATIVSAIAEGRQVYSNIRRFITFLFAANTGLVLLVGGTSALGLAPILTPTQILWINLITNGLPALALGMESNQGQAMTQPPRPTDEPLLRKPEILSILLSGTWMAVSAFLAFHYFQPSPPTARTMAFSVLAMGPLFHAFNARSNRSALAVGIFSNPTLLWAVTLGLVLQGIAVYTPSLQAVFGTSALSLKEVLVTLSLSASVWVIGELAKWTRNRHPRALTVPK
jgi:Ca2+-transporting ATPase